MVPVQIGDMVVYMDGNGDSHNALVTNLLEGDLVSLIFVSSDETATDEYGRQIERKTSVPHKSAASDGSAYWVEWEVGS